MTRVFFIGAALLLLDVFPGNCGRSHGPPIPTGVCQTTCDCSTIRNPTIKCPGRWECNAQKTCQYSCFEPCEEDGGCVTAGKTCSDSFCKSPLSCP